MNTDAKWQYEYDEEKTAEAIREAKRAYIPRPAKLVPKTSLNVSREAEQIFNGNQLTNRTEVTAIQNKLGLRKLDGGLWDVSPLGKEIEKTVIIKKFNGNQIAYIRSGR